MRFQDCNERLYHRSELGSFLKIKKPLTLRVRESSMPTLESEDPNARRFPFGLDFREMQSVGRRKYDQPNIKAGQSFVPDFPDLIHRPGLCVPLAHERLEGRFFGARAGRGGVADGI